MGKITTMRATLVSLLVLVLALLGASNAASAPACGTPRLSGPVVQGWFADMTTATSGYGSLLSVPPEVNLVDIWGALANYSDADREIIAGQIDTLHSRGQVVVHDIWLNDAYGFTGSGQPYTKAGYEAWAKSVYEDVVAWNMDGIDIDLETSIMLDTDERNIGVMNALAKYFGPKSRTGKYLIIDTNLPGSHPVISQTASNYDYIILQAYWRPASDLDGLWSSFAPLIDPDQFVVTVSFEDGSGWEPYGTNCPQVYDYAAWAYANGSGVGAYKINKDYDNTPSYKYTLGAIEIMNGAPEATVCGEA